MQRQGYFGNKEPYVIIEAYALEDFRGFYDVATGRIDIARKKASRPIMHDAVRHSWTLSASALYMETMAHASGEEDAVMLYTGKNRGVFQPLGYDLKEAERWLKMTSWWFW